MRYTTDDERWEAVAARDGRADGVFLLAVRTTGIYCHPSCRARTPNRANACFFETAEDARAAGFRACKVCRPDEPVGTHPSAGVVAVACRIIEDAAGPVPLSRLAASVHVSSSHLRRVFRDLTGLTPRQYADAVRSERVRGLLREGLAGDSVSGGAAAGDSVTDANSRPGPSITRAAYAAGFGSGSRFYAAAEEILGMTPSAYRSGAAGERIRFSIARCSLGLVMVAATDRGLCAVEFGEDSAVLRAALRRRFPRADLREGAPGFARWVAETVALIETPVRSFNLPLDIQGTAFQRLVWDALRQIPSGSTVTYAEVAARVGRPAAARAVAGACAANRLAVVVPCHRVVRADGAVSGYRWGVGRKRALLERESAPEAGMRAVDGIPSFVDALTEWAATRSDIEAVALVGSYARGTANALSDVDVVLLVRDPAVYLANRAWLDRFGTVGHWTTEDYGALTSVRVWYRGGVEVEFGLATTDWARSPLDDGTRSVIEGGMRVLHERRPLLSPHVSVAVE
ncbi:MAG: methylated-DNA--[protein]-cysteine S-methyltransferase [Thermoleophilia bacterium]